MIKPTTIYWVSTVLLASILLISAYTYFFHKGTIDGVRALGFPDFFRVQLGVLKLIAAAVLLIPSVPNLIKQCAYAGAGFFFITAIVAHLANKDPVAISLVSVFFIAVLVVSNFSLYRL